MPYEYPVRCKIVHDEQDFDLALHFNVTLHKLGTDVTIHRNQWEAGLRVHRGNVDNTVHYYLDPDRNGLANELLLGLLGELMMESTGVTLIKLTPYIIYLDKSKAVDDEVIAECVEAVGNRLGLS